MKRNPFGYNPYLGPLTLWTRLAMQTAQMMLASSQVIAHRTARMARAGPVPNARDRREFALMGQEKIEAAAQSAQAMTAYMLTLNSGRAKNPAALALRGLKPIHAKATANAKRLRKR